MSREVRPAAVAIPPVPVAELPVSPVTIPSVPITDLAIPSIATPRFTSESTKPTTVSLPTLPTVPVTRSSPPRAS